MSFIAFLRSNTRALGVSEFDIGNHPYRVGSIPAHIFEKDAEALALSMQNDPLKKRVTALPALPGQAEQRYDVDKFFTVTGHTPEQQQKAMALWSRLRWHCAVLGTGTMVLTVGAWRLARAHAPLLGVLAAGVATACLAFFTGNKALHGFITAHQQLAVWRNPGEDFALKRKEAAALPLQEKIAEKVHYHEHKGMLLGIEILRDFKLQFKAFAEALLGKPGKTWKERNQWIQTFFAYNPLAIDFFKENPALLNDGWRDVQTCQTVYAQLCESKKQLEDKSIVPALAAKLAEQIGQIPDFIQPRIEEAKQRAETIQLNGVDPTECHRCKEKFLGFFKTQLNDRLKAYLELQQRVLQEQPLLILYPRAEHFLTEAKKELIDKQAAQLLPNYKMDESGLAFDLLSARDALAGLIKQNAKAFGPPDANYQAFVDEFLKP